MANKSQKFTVILEEEANGTFSVRCPALPGCFGQGDDRELALANIRDGIRDVLEIIESGDIDQIVRDSRPITETSQVIANQVLEVLEARLEDGLPPAIEIVEVELPIPVVA